MIGFMRPVDWLMNKQAVRLTPGVSDEMLALYPDASIVQNHQNDPLQYTIVEKGKDVGFVSIPEERNVLLALAPEARGRGLMDEALRKIIAQHGELEWNVRPRNMASLRLLARMNGGIRDPGILNVPEWYSGYTGASAKDHARLLALIS